MTVNICGIPHKVIYCKDSFDIDTHLGMICYKENEIRINEDMSVFLHIHALKGE